MTYLLLQECSCVAKVEVKRPRKKLRDKLLWITGPKNLNAGSMKTIINLKGKTITWEWLYNFKSAYEDVHGK